MSTLYTPSRSDVAALHVRLLEQLTQDVSEVTELGIETLKQGRFDETRRVLDYATGLNEIRRQAQVILNPIVQIPIDEPAPEPVAEPPAPVREAQLAVAEYFIPILLGLDALGGRARPRDVQQHVRTFLEKRFMPYDLEKSAGRREMRWQSTTGWAANALKRAGMLNDKADRGIWLLTDAGHRAISDIKNGKYDDVLRTINAARSRRR